MCREKLETGDFNALCSAFLRSFASQNAVVANPANPRKKDMVTNHTCSARPAMTQSSHAPNHVMSANTSRRMRPNIGRVMFMFCLRVHPGGLKGHLRKKIFYLCFVIIYLQSAVCIPGSLETSSSVSERTTPGVPGRYGSVRLSTGTGTGMQGRIVVRQSDGSLRSMTGCTAQGAEEPAIEAFQFSREQLSEAYAHLKKTHDECATVSTDATLTDAALYRKLNVLRTFLNLKLDLRVTIQVLKENGDIIVYNGVSRMQPVHRLLLHFALHQDDPACTYVYAVEGTSLDPADALRTWNDLMNPADTQFTISQSRETTVLAAQP